MFGAFFLKSYMFGLVLVNGPDSNSHYFLSQGSQRASRSKLKETRKLLLSDYFTIIISNYMDWILIMKARWTQALPMDPMAQLWKSWSATQMAYLKPNPIWLQRKKRGLWATLLHLLRSEIAQSFRWVESLIPHHQGIVFLSRHSATQHASRPLLCPFLLGATLVLLFAGAGMDETLGNGDWGARTSSPPTSETAIIIYGRL